MLLSPSLAFYRSWHNYKNAFVDTAPSEFGTFRLKTRTARAHTQIEYTTPQPAQAKRNMQHKNIPNTPRPRPRSLDSRHPRDRHMEPPTHLVHVKRFKPREVFDDEEAVSRFFCERVAGELEVAQVSHQSQNPQTALLVAGTTREGGNRIRTESEWNGIRFVRRIPLSVGAMARGNGRNATEQEEDAWSG